MRKREVIPGTIVRVKNLKDIKKGTELGELQLDNPELIGMEGLVEEDRSVDSNFILVMFDKRIKGRVLDDSDVRSAWYFFPQNLEKVN